jgi:ABC-type multidrug transport system fused ATPase/permease subunit
VDGASLRAVVGVVPQQVHLFDGDVVANIAVGELEPQLERVMAVAGLLGITAFVEALPGGFHTPLGENGASLSGGERQRLAIARALYRDPQVLILDEATSSLDSVSERFVQRAIHRARAQGKTVIVIAHRLSTVMHADHIAVLAGGAVVEEGTHAELIRRGGAYRRLWAHQVPVAARVGAAGPSLSTGAQVRTIRQQWPPAARVPTREPVRPMSPPELEVP